MTTDKKEETRERIYTLAEYKQALDYLVRNDILIRDNFGLDCLREAVTDEFRGCPKEFDGDCDKCITQFVLELARRS